MIYLGSIMFFRWEKYRFVSPLESFLAFCFCTIIAEYKSEAMDETYTIYGQSNEKGRAIFLTLP
jgi:hypothetical protein